ncbi:MurR/RpiR family transcriptional regulator [Paucisalibacillus sp. EB02]|uniref:MurR/RpiR family transcriptional regulator n=1 Tax=Paucisalibacillus sp. EB02 TaxID=1347087 RepID=UPI0004BB2B09|nr:MurR/RpiR family transcriptional regulator [Paucisalibacillus sp. EB02]
MKYLNLINSCYSDLTKSEKKIADYIKEVGKEIIYQSIQEVTQTVKVGDATVIRFCKKIGFDGFQDLKLQIAMEDLTEQNPSFDSYIDRIQSNFNQAINNTISLIDEKVLNRAIEVLEKAERIFIFGVGASGLAAQEAQASFLRIGRTVKAVIDARFQSMEAATLTDNDVVIVLSLSGRTRDVYESISIAKNNNAIVIAITNFILSPIAQLSDLVLSTAMKESLIDGGSLSAKISQLLVIDILTTGYALKNKEQSNAFKQEIAKSILNKIME